MSDSQPVAAPAPAPAASSAPKVPYVGSLISLISRSGIRYVGTLYTIDTKASTVALKDVKSFGTEGRHREEGPVEPSTHVYSFIIFRGPDILDLQFLPTPSRETTTDAVKPTQTTQSKSSPAAPKPVPAPAQQPTPQPPKPEPKESPPAAKPAPPPTPSAPVPAHLPTPRAWGPPPGQDLEAKKPQRSDEQKPPSVSGAQPVPARAQNSRRPLPADPSKRDGENSQIQNGSNGTSSAQQLPHQNVPNGAGASTRNNQRPPNGRQNGGPNSSSRPRRNWRRGPGIKIPDEDFDFATMNSKFSKATIQSAENDGSTDAFPPVEVRYDKSKSFFDDLATDKTVGSDRTNAAQRRATDFETFGETGGYRHRSYRNRGRRNANRGRNRSGGRGYPYGSRPAPTRNDESERA